MTANNYWLDCKMSDSKKNATLKKFLALSAIFMGCVLGVRHILLRASESIKQEQLAAASNAIDVNQNTGDKNIVNDTQQAAVQQQISTNNEANNQDGNTDMLYKECIHLMASTRAIVTIDKENIENAIREMADKNKKFLIILSATWCAPCQKLKQFLTDCSNDVIGKIDALIINDNIAEFDMSIVYKLFNLDSRATSYPTIYCIDNGAVTKTITGFSEFTKAQLIEFAH